MPRQDERCKSGGCMMHFGWQVRHESTLRKPRGINSCRCCVHWESAEQALACLETINWPVGRSSPRLWTLHPKAP